MAGVLDTLLEGFATPPPEPPRQGNMKPGDKVRVKPTRFTPAEQETHGRIQRFEPDGVHAVIAPDGGVPHVLAKISQLSFDTAQRRAKAAAQQPKPDPNALPGTPGQPPGLSGKAGPPNAAGKPGAKFVRVAVAEGELLGTLLEAFAAAPAPETPAQSQAIAGKQVSAAISANSHWDASKHPRATGGKFGYTTGGKRATRSTAAITRTVGPGSNGAMVRSIQRQLGVKVDGVYGPQTRAAIQRYQRQHGLVVDGVVGRQTLAALKGHSNPASVKPGPISAKAATVNVHPTKRTKRAPALGSVGTNFGGGVVA
jgi:peptidoglycan hydrolase-like protein with peptidoglycan-binding domain